MPLGCCSEAVGAVVLIVTVTEVALEVLLGAKRQVDSLGRPEQLYVTGRTVDELVPLVTMNPVELATVNVTGPLVWPCATVRVPVPRLEFRVKLSVVAVTVRLTVVELDVDPDAPFTVTVAVPDAVLGAV